MPFSGSCSRCSSSVFPRAGRRTPARSGSASRVCLAGLDPASALEGPVPLVARQVFDTLLRYSDGGSDVEPGLAVQWSVSRDGLVWTFRLREGVPFHDGTPLTSQHVVDSLERLIRPGHPNAPAVNAAAPRLLRGVPGIVKEIRGARQANRADRARAAVRSAARRPRTSLPLDRAAVASGEARAPLQGTGTVRRSSRSRPNASCWTRRPGHWAGGPRVGRLVFTGDSGHRLKPRRRSTPRPSISSFPPARRPVSPAPSPFRAGA